MYNEVMAAGIRRGEVENPSDPVSVKENASRPTAGWLQDLFTSWAETDPNLPAIICMDRLLSYGEIARIANALGAQLRAFGAGPGTPVAVVMESGWEQIAAALGAMIAGAPLVPVDAWATRGSLEQLLDAASVELVVTQPGLRGQLAFGHGRRIFQVSRSDLPPLRRGKLPGTRVARGLRAVAALIYDCEAKAANRNGRIEISHAQAVAAVGNLGALLDIGIEDKVTMVVPFASEAFLFCTFATLAAGATLIVPAPGETRDARLLLELISDYGSTVWCSTPTVTQSLFERDSQGPRLALSAIRKVLLMGDWIPVKLLGQLRSEVPGIGVVALGGGPPAADVSPNNGRDVVDPMSTSMGYRWAPDHSRFRVLSKNLKDCPAFAPGEIYLGTSNARPNGWLTMDAPDGDSVLHPKTGERLYATGQRGRLLPDGVVEFLLPRGSRETPRRLL